MKKRWLVRRGFAWRTCLGWLAALAMGGAAVGLAAILPNTAMVHLGCVVILPFVLALAFSRNLLVSGTLVWLNEGFVGVGGNWVSVGGISGRALLLGGLVGTYGLLWMMDKKRWSKLRSRQCWVLFYGLLLPCLLLAYSVGIKGVALRGALADVMRFSAILGFFPLYYCLKRQPHLVLGWLLGAGSLLSILYVLLAVAPFGLRLALLEKWIAGFSAEELNMAYVNSPRAFFTPLILCLTGLFLGLVLSFNGRGVVTRTLGCCGTALGSAAFVVNFARGPIVGVGFGIVFLMTVYWKAARIGAAFCLAALTALVVVSGYAYTVKYLEVSFGKWNVKDKDLTDLVDEVRVEQTVLMLRAWMEEPLLGKGVGCPIKGYSRTDEDEGLAFEVQYPMVLYRTGIVGFLVILTPFFIFLRRTYRAMKRLGRGRPGPYQLVNLGLCCTIVALLTASAANPYLASSMTVLLMALFVASDSARDSEGEAGSGRMIAHHE